MSTENVKFRGLFLKASRRSAGIVLREKWPAVILVVVSGLASGAFAAAFAEMVSSAVNYISNNRAGYENTEYVSSLRSNSADNSYIFNLVISVFPSITVFSVFLLSIVTAVLVAVLMVLAGKAKASLGAHIYSQLRQDAFDRCFDSIHVVNAARKINQEDTPGGVVNLASSLNRGADAVSNTYTYILTAFQQAFAFLSAIFTSGARMLPATIACVCVIILQILAAQHQAKKLRDTRNRLDVSSNALQASTAETLEAREVLVAFDKVREYKKTLGDLVSAVAALQAANDSAQSRYDAIYDLINKWGQIAVIGIVVFIIAMSPILLPSYGVESGRMQPLFFVLTLYSTLLSPARELIGGYDSVKRTEAIAESFLMIFSIDISDRNNGLEVGWLKNQPIILRDVSYFAPGRAEAVLTGFDLVVPPNKTTLILGPSGCGKTTIARICLGFLRPNEGDVVIGGRPIQEWSSEYLYKSISYAPQVDQILEGAISKNLRLAEDVNLFSDAVLNEALDAVKLRNGDPSRLNANAKNLSGGEMQRLSAARIILDQAEIVVLDEPMAGVDVFTMAEIAPAIERHWRKTNQTVLLISHKFVFAGLADNVVVLTENGIAEQGPPKELLRNKGMYFKAQQEALRQAGA